MQTFKQTFAAGEMKPFHMPGRFFRILASDGGVDLKFYKNGGLIGSASDVDAGFAWEGGRNSVGGSLFDRVDITGAGGVVKFAVSDDPVSYDRMAGVISVISGELVRVKNNEAFMVADSAAAVAAAYASCQLWNPATSGVNLFVNSVVVMVGAAGAFCSARRHDIALASLLSNGVSKRSGAPGSVAEARYENPALPAGVAVQTFGLGTAYESKQIPFSEPIMLAPGAGLVIGCSIPNVSIWASYQWIEEAI